MLWIEVTNFTNLKYTVQYTGTGTGIGIILAFLIYFLQKHALKSSKLRRLKRGILTKKFFWDYHFKS
jgi:ABC-type phosphate/phosphonate transport system permease subunit